MNVLSQLIECCKNIWTIGIDLDQQCDISDIQVVINTRGAFGAYPAIFDFE